ncbi:putative 50S ribosomal protein L17 [Besnoitia besnoiti]|uniref:Putative 50S ribosomal protein L17 n=1 Tax=Besnoitia besnoiti TaxID=94643 RepID=A0A2A9MFY3_BESBE|nr:putative 50S ribosomal protein L17 [Besnoitia besnoiti]PFH37418.1 putative 50S ribosomal protein L17 [Besnoitia besnoiti]
MALPAVSNIAAPASSGRRVGSASSVLIHGFLVAHTLLCVAVVDVCGTRVYSRPSRHTWASLSPSLGYAAAERAYDALPLVRSSRGVTSFEGTTPTPALSLPLAPFSLLFASSHVAPTAPQWGQPRSDGRASMMGDGVQPVQSSGKGRPILSVAFLLVAGGNARARSAAVLPLYGAHSEATFWRHSPESRSASFLSTPQGSFSPGSRVRQEGASGSTLRGFSAVAASPAGGCGSAGTAALLRCSREAPQGSLQSRACASMIHAADSRSGDGQNPTEVDAAPRRSACRPDRVGAARRRGFSVICGDSGASAPFSRVAGGLNGFRPQERDAALLETTSPRRHRPAATEARRPPHAFFRSPGQTTVKEPPLVYCLTGSAPSASSREGDADCPVAGGERFGQTVEATQGAGGVRLAEVRDTLWQAPLRKLPRDADGRPRGVGGVAMHAHHNRKRNKLNRPYGHRRCLLRNLCTEVLRHGAITTTYTKAKECRRATDKLIMLAKEPSLHTYRQALGYLYDKALTRQLFLEAPQRFAYRPHGFCRLTKLPFCRLGDNARMARLELID